MYRGIFVYNIYLIKINDSVSYRTVKIFVEYWKRHGMINSRYLGTGYFLCDTGLRMQNFIKNVWAR